MSKDGEMPLVSAVIPTRNRPKLVCRAVRSALGQTYKWIEVVVVVDGPDSATLAALSELDDPRLRIISLRSNVGGSEARNVGAREAKGKYVALLDDDDEWLPEKLEEQVALAELHSGEDVLLTSRYFFRVDRKKDIIRPRRLPHEGENLSEYIFQPYCSFHTSTYVCTRNLFIRNPFTKGLASPQDIDWYLRLVKSGTVRLLIVDKPLSIYNCPLSRASISTHVTWEKRFDYGRQNRQLFTRYGYGLFLARLARHAGSGMSGWRARLRILEEMFLARATTLRALSFFVLFSIEDLG